MGKPSAPGAAADVGLCFACSHGRAQANARGSTFWRCLRADSEPDFLRYPPLPVERCRGFEARDDPPAS